MDCIANANPDGFYEFVDSFEMKLHSKTGNDVTSIVHLYVRVVDLSCMSLNFHKQCQIRNQLEFSPCVSLIRIMPTLFSLLLLFDHSLKQVEF